MEVQAAASWSGANISFWLITAVVLGSAACAAFSASVVSAAYSLFFTLFGMAGYYVLLGSDFLAVTQVIIYVGGILVLLMFGVMLTNRPLEKAQPHRLRRCLPASLVGAVFFGGVLWPAVMHGRWRAAGEVGAPLQSTRALGRALLGEYLLVLETAGMTLLLCLVGAAYLLRRRDDDSGAGG